MMKQQSGFTLIELIMVIVVLGALAVSVIPRYVDLQTEADDAAIEGVAGSVAAGMAINYAACVAGDVACLSQADGMTDCDETAVTIAGGATGVPATDYTITAAAFGATAVGDTFTCTLDDDNGPATTTFEAIVPPATG